ELAEFDRMLELASKTIEFLDNSAPWQLQAIQAGRDGEPARREWESLIQKIETTWSEVHECRLLIMEHGPEISESRPPHELLSMIDEIIQHREAGRSLGILSKLTKPRWFEFKASVRVGNGGLELDNLSHLRAARALLRLRQCHSELIERWERQMAAQGGLTCAELGERPELVCKQFVPQIKVCLDWHATTWRPLEDKFQRLGFRWSAFLDATPVESADNGELRRIRRAVLGDLRPILQSRRDWLRHKKLQVKLDDWYWQVPEFDNPPAAQATLRL